MMFVGLISVNNVSETCRDPVKEALTGVDDMLVVQISETGKSNPL